MSENSSFGIILIIVTAILIALGVAFFAASRNHEQIEQARIRAYSDEQRAMSEYMDSQRHEMEQQVQDYQERINELQVELTSLRNSK